MAFKKALQNLTKQFLDFIFPPQCILCGKTDSKSKYPNLCSDCFGSFEAIREPFCTICGIPFGSKDIPSHPCGACQKSRPAFDSVRAAGIYDGRLGETIRAYKYQKKRFLYRPLGDFLTAGLRDPVDYAKADMIVSVPLFKKKLKKRGFDQAFLLAGEVGKKLSKRVCFSNLVKSEDTLPQAELDFIRRKTNVHGSFSVNDCHEFEGKIIILVDDVMTTGSTLNECARVLKKDGKAGEVHCLVLARSLPNC